MVRPTDRLAPGIEDDPNEDRNKRKELGNPALEQGVTLFEGPPRWRAAIEKGTDDE